MRLAFRSASAWCAQDTGRKAAAPEVNGPAGRTAVERDAVGEVLPKSHTSDLFSCHKTRTTVPHPGELEGSNPKWSTPDPWKPHSVNCKALKFSSSHPTEAFWMPWVIQTNLRLEPL